MSQASEPTESPYSLRVDFTWRKLQYHISDARTNNSLMIVKHNCTKPHLEFIETDNKSTIMGTASIHNFSIHADCAIGSQYVQLKAQKRFTTEYSYLSNAYSDDENPMVMTWTSSTSLKKWDLVLLDDKREAVARYSINIWALKKIGTIEFVGPKAKSKAARDEVVITVCTLYYCMTVRAMSILSPFNAVFADVKPLQGRENAKEVSEAAK